MSRILLIYLIGVLGAIHGPPGILRANNQDELIKQIVSSWQERQANVQTVSCVMNVDSFYPKGYVSEEWLFGRGKLPGEGILPSFPASDTRITRESYSLAIDFDQANVRKEIALTIPSYSENDFSLVVADELHLFHEGNYRMFRRNVPPRDEDSALNPIVADVTLYEGASHQGLFQFSDLPILWIAGNINGRYPLPLKLRSAPASEMFSYRGKVRWQNNDCVILTTQEQNGPSARREFWVGIRPPHLIYKCSARMGEDFFWTIEIEYDEQTPDQVRPTKWKCTNYNYPNPNSLMTTRTYRVESLNTNSHLPDDLFHKNLEPGMIARHVEKNETFEVGDDGSLVPVDYSHKRSSDRFLWIAIIGVTVVVGSAVGVFLFRRSCRRRLE